MSRVIICLDWSGQEARLTAHASGDVNLTNMLADEMNGGQKVHAVTAGMIYKIDPKDAKTHMVSFKGRMAPAYDAGKMGRHGFNYGVKKNKLAQQLWVPIAQATNILETLSQLHPDVVAWREQLANEVFGVALYQCPKCGFEAEGKSACPRCIGTVSYAPVLQFVGMKQYGTRELRTAFGRRRLYLGRKGEGANAVASQIPQGGGASIWYRTAARLHGYDVESGAAWPTPVGVLRYDPDAPLGRLLDPAEVTVMTGTYDSYYIEAPETRQYEITEWALWTMEQPWPQLGGLRLPAEAAIGYNAKKHGVKNERGLKDYAHTPYQVNPDHWRVPERGDNVPVLSWNH